MMLNMHFRVRSIIIVREDDRPMPIRRKRIFYPTHSSIHSETTISRPVPNRNAGSNHLFHRKRVNDFTPVVCQFSRFIGVNALKQLGGKDFSWIRGKNSIDFFPYLNFTDLLGKGFYACR